MTDGMPALIAAEIDQVLQRAIKAEQELAAAEAEIRALKRRVANGLSNIDRHHSKMGGITLGDACILDALTGESDIDATCGAQRPLTDDELDAFIAYDRSHYWGQP